MTRMHDLHVIINPSSRPTAILHILNSVCHELGVAWEIEVTRGPGDGFRMAQAARDRGVPVVAVYGGDGSVMEAARGLMGGSTQLAILPGGTANAVAVELGIPLDGAQAIRLACGEGAVSRPLDMGRVGDVYFVLRAGIGISAEQVRKADRAFKNRFGKMAYALALAEVLKTPARAAYRVVLDGRPMEWEGAGCMIDNAGGFGVPGLTHDPAVDLSDGLLDVFFTRTLSQRSTLAILADAADVPVLTHNERHAARRIEIEAEPPQAVQLDGEVWGETPVTVEVVPAAAHVIVPADETLGHPQRRRGVSRTTPIV